VELVIGARPAQPTKVITTKHKTISLPEIKCATKAGDARSFTSSTAGEADATWQKSFATHAAFDFPKRVQNASASLSE
jgi:hypothetical protein